MANGEGALVAQQREAADIPYRNIQAGQTSASMFMNTFMKAQEIGTQRRKLEEALQAAYLKNDLAEKKHADDMNMQELRYGLQVQGLQLRAGAMENSANNAAARIALMNDSLGLRDRIEQDKLNKEANTNESVTTLMSSLHGIDPSDPDFYKKITDLGANPNVAAALRTPFGRQLFAQHKDDYNKFATRASTAYKAANDSFIKNRNNEFYNGMNLGDDIFIHPEWWGKAYDDAGKELPGQASYKLPIADKAGKPIYITKPVGLINEYGRQWKELQARKLKLPQQINDEDVKAAPAAAYSTGLNTKQLQALDWARNNPGDPRAAQIKQKLGINE